MSDDAAADRSTTTGASPATGAGADPGAGAGPGTGAGLGADGVSSAGSGSSVDAGALHPKLVPIRERALARRVGITITRPTTILVEGVPGPGLVQQAATLLAGVFGQRPALPSPAGTQWYSYTVGADGRVRKSRVWAPYRA
ncbi:hypothetical protein [Frigoribacterium faeni]|uniref:Uncharacterized protein n=1 Tax=Frigoribacterium faeni TaxID=145483 RepID=A0A7W3JJ82_9MICO|nr:hypothetical protein [Frigoribacterium faeni]MBA8813830.1 hypothetical protein [Frigoribacterium faeni]BFF15149.1 hypothetical protein GCM10025699_64520 [Microbacterium flavescens]GEK82195.1 hypothetical protein FFA01_05040 [Frigoribacterium faeni]